MDKDEARGVLSEHLATYRALSYEELVERVDGVETAEVQGLSGIRYHLEVQFLWDSKPHGDVRVIGSVDDGGWRAFVPLSEDFVRAADGTFVGE
jgi:hypothetical protein